MYALICTNTIHINFHALRRLFREKKTQTKSIHAVNTLARHVCMCACVCVGTDKFNFKQLLICHSTTLHVQAHSNIVEQLNYAYIKINKAIIKIGPLYDAQLSDWLLWMSEKLSKKCVFAVSKYVRLWQESEWERKIKWAREWLGQIRRVAVYYSFPFRRKITDWAGC